MGHIISMWYSYSFQQAHYQSPSRVGVKHLSYMQEILGSSPSQVLQGIFDYT